MRRLVSGVLLAAVMMAGSAVAPAAAEQIGHEGCTPGYWKNHTDNWEETRPGVLLSNIYNVSAALTGVTLEEALGLPGGPGVDGAERNLARAATAAWLNAAHEGLGYPWRRFANGLDGRPPLVQFVNDALASGDRATMLAAAERLDTDNNLGCPLN
ncbi:MAG: hypothetical protein ACRDO7_02445 [Nocardioidaceae bacterium]